MGNVKEKISFLREFYRFKQVGQVSDTRLNWSPGMAVDQERNLYVTCQQKNNIVKYNRDLKFISQWGTFGTNEGQFNTPAGIDVLGNAVYIVDAKNKRIQIFDTTGRLLNIINENISDGLDFECIGQVAVTRDQHVFVVMNKKNLVYLLDDNFKIKQVFDLNRYAGEQQYKISSIIHDKTRQSVYVGKHNGRIFNLSGAKGIMEVSDFDVSKFAVASMTDFYFHGDNLIFKDTHTDSIYKLSKEGCHFKWRNQENSLVKIMLVEPNRLYMSVGSYRNNPGIIKVFEI